MRTETDRLLGGDLGGRRIGARPKGPLVIGSGCRANPRLPVIVRERSRVAGLM